MNELLTSVVKDVGERRKTAGINPAAR